MTEIKEQNLFDITSNEFGSDLEFTPERGWTSTEEVTTIGYFLVGTSETISLHQTFRS